MHAACVAYIIVPDLITLTNNEYKKSYGSSLIWWFLIFDFVEQVTRVVLIQRTDVKFFLLYDMEAQRAE
jgi:hypothetical protein